jgi:hypothetical protein
MLACQREHFDIPRDVAYLNAAAWSPLPHAVVAAGHRGSCRPIISSSNSSVRAVPRPS